MFKNFCHWFTAYFRWDMKAVCELSASGDVDYHDYPDSIYGEPFHFVTHVCKRCGKRFDI